MHFDKRCATMLNRKFCFAKIRGANLPNTSILLAEISVLRPHNLSSLTTPKRRGLLLLNSGRPFGVLPGSSSRA
jgi:hypothetical protein